MDELIAELERMKEATALDSNVQCILPETFDRILAALRQAATVERQRDELAAIIAERDRMMEAMGKAAGAVTAELLATRTQRDELAAALEPFALKARVLCMLLNPVGQRDDCPVPNGDGLTLGHYRRAAAALAAVRGAK